MHGCDVFEVNERTTYVSLVGCFSSSKLLNVVVNVYAFKKREIFSVLYSILFGRKFIKP